MSYSSVLLWRACWDVLLETCCEKWGRDQWKWRTGIWTLPAITVSYDCFSWLQNMHIGRASGTCCYHFNYRMLVLRMALRKTRMSTKYTTGEKLTNEIVSYDYFDDWCNEAGPMEFQEAETRQPITSMTTNRFTNTISRKASHAQILTKGNTKWNTKWSTKWNTKWNTKYRVCQIISGRETTWPFKLHGVFFPPKHVLLQSLERM